MSLFERVKSFFLGSSLASASESSSSASSSSSSASSLASPSGGRKEKHEVVYGHNKYGRRCIVSFKRNEISCMHFMLDSLVSIIQFYIQETGITQLPLSFPVTLANILIYTLNTVVFDLGYGFAADADGMVHSKTRGQAMRVSDVPRSLEKMWLFDLLFPCVHEFYPCRRFETNAAVRDAFERVHKRMCGDLSLSRSREPLFKHCTELRQYQIRAVRLRYTKDHQQHEGGFHLTLRQLNLLDMYYAYLRAFSAYFSVETWQSICAERIETSQSDNDFCRSLGCKVVIPTVARPIMRNIRVNPRDLSLLIDSRSTSIATTPSIQFRTPGVFACTRSVLLVWCLRLAATPLAKALTVKTNGED